MWSCIWWKEVAAPQANCPGSPSLRGEMTVSEEPQPEVGQEQSCPRLMWEGGNTTSPPNFTKPVPFFGKSVDEGKEGVCVGSQVCW